ncbi:hypothetical protein PR048_009836 [Dryococelus australis]|uniref:Uncharacterized protein n=1 Tax=Dryococelus australis TaxID=614101 RepID=A0ABQ9I124_9NEOP|nr:hypothetical protein PR048_009836 [Dryococelus australis]
MGRGKSDEERVRYAASTLLWPDVTGAGAESLEGVLKVAVVLHEEGSSSRELQHLRWWSELLSINWWDGGCALAYMEGQLQALRLPSADRVVSLHELRGSAGLLGAGFYHMCGGGVTAVSMGAPCLGVCWKALSRVRPQLIVKTPIYLELFSAFEAERRGNVKGDTATHKSPIAAKRKALNWRAVFSSCSVYLWDFQRQPYYFIGGKYVERFNVCPLTSFLLYCVWQSFYSAVLNGELMGSSNACPPLCRYVWDAACKRESRNTVAPSPCLSKASLVLIILRDFNHREARIMSHREARIMRGIRVRQEPYDCLGSQPVNKVGVVGFQVGTKSGVTHTTLRQDSTCLLEGEAHFSLLAGLLGCRAVGQQPAPVMLQWCWCCCCLHRLGEGSPEGGRLLRAASSGASGWQRLLAAAGSAELVAAKEVSKLCVFVMWLKKSEIFNSHAMADGHHLPSHTPLRQPRLQHYISPCAAGLQQSFLFLLSRHLERCSVIGPTEIFQVLSTPPVGTSDGDDQSSSDQ